MANSVNKKKTTTTRKKNPRLAKDIEEIKKEEEIEVIEDSKKVVKKPETKKPTVKKEEKEKIEKKEVKETKEIKETNIATNEKGFLIPFISIISLVSFILYIILKYLDNKDFLKDTNMIIVLSVLLLMNIIFIILGFSNHNKKLNKLIILILLLITGLNTYNILVLKDVIKFTQKEKEIPNFYNKPITDVYKWNTYNINISETYEYSDIIPAYNVISQDVSPNTPIKEVETINFIVSNGPNYDLETVVPNFIGWEYNTVIDYLEKHFLNNVQIEFVKSNNKENTVISQEGSGSRKRNDLIKLTFALKEVTEVEVIDLSNYSLIKATGWLAQNNLKYEINYENDDSIQKDYVISNSNVGDTINLEEEQEVIIKLRVSKGKIIKAPAFKTMTQDEINEWIMENDMKVSYQEKYDEETSLGDVISSSVNENDVVESGSLITIVISKGRLEMPKIDTIDNFKIWASENNVKYQINSEFSDSIPNGDIIKSSHKTGAAIKEDDTVIITVSKGKSVTVPNFIGMTKSSAQSKCSSMGLSCSFKYGGYTEKNKDIVVNQSQRSGIKISSGANIVITLSSGVQPKVTVPNFKGKSKSEITSTCKSLGITCNFSYQSSYSSTPKDTCVSQSKTGTVNKGSTISITLSKGPAQTYKLSIYESDCTWGNAQATKDNLASKLKKNYPNVKFNITCRKVESGIGYPIESSPIGIGSYTVTEGKTYNIIIGGECK